jgi:hypothetical protein
MVRTSFFATLQRRCDLTRTNPAAAVLAVIESGGTILADQSMGSANRLHASTLTRWVRRAGLGPVVPDMVPRNRLVRFRAAAPGQRWRLRLALGPPGLRPQGHIRASVHTTSSYERAAIWHCTYLADAAVDRSASAGPVRPRSRNLTMEMTDEGRCELPAPSGRPAFCGSRA